MVDPHYSYFIKELKRQVAARVEMAIVRRCEYEGNDPIMKLPLTDLQKGLVAGRTETWEVFEQLITDTVEEVLRLYTYETIEEKDQ